MNEKNMVPMNEITEIEELEQKIAPSGSASYN